MNRSFNTCGYIFLTALKQAKALNIYKTTFIYTEPKLKAKADRRFSSLTGCNLFESPIPDPSPFSPFHFVSIQPLIIYSS